MLPLLPSCTPIPPSPILAGAFFAVIIRFRNYVLDFILSLKNRTYGDPELSVLLGIPLYAAAVVASRFVPVDLSFYVFLLLGLFLTVDGAISAITGAEKRDPLRLRSFLLLVLLQGLLFPYHSTFSFLFPALLAKRVEWKPSLLTSSLISLVPLSKGFLYVPDFSLLAGFLSGVLLLSIYYHAPEYINENTLRSLYGLMMLLICFLGV